MTVEHGVELLREFGFPVLVALWFMWRLEKRVDRLFELMSSLMQSTAVLAKSVDNHIDSTRSSQRQISEGNDQGSNR